MSSNPHFLTNKRIIISGAGISGLSFALSLHQLWPSSSPLPPPSVTIYERDPHDVDPSRQGYSISIRSDTGGIQSLQKLGVLDEMLAASITGLHGAEHGGFALWDRDWKPIMRAKGRIPKGLPVSSMRIRRSELRRILIEKVEELGVEIIWGKTCLGAVRALNPLGPSRQVALSIRDSPSVPCDLLIVADGSHSKIRGAVRSEEEDRLHFAGAVQIMGTGVFPPSSSEPIPEPMNKDYGLYLSGTGTGSFVAPVDEHSAVWSVSYLSSEPRELVKPPYTEQQAEELMQEALERGKRFKEPFQTLVRHTDIKTLGMLNAMDKGPFPHTSSGQSSGIVFIGDANHAVSPFAGNGANMALQDGWDLAECLCGFEKVEEALKAYDAKSMPRAKSSLRFSHFTIGLAHSEGWGLWIYSLLFRIMGLFMGW